MTQILVFTSIETSSQISTFESFVFTFYLNETENCEIMLIWRIEKHHVYLQTKSRCVG